MQKQYQRPEAQIVEGGDIVCSSQEQSLICDDYDVMTWWLTVQGTSDVPFEFVKGVTTVAELEAWLSTVELYGMTGWDKKMKITITDDGRVICGSTQQMQE